jgi:hypothetical protein
VGCRLPRQGGYMLIKKQSLQCHTSTHPPWSIALDTPAFTSSSVRAFSRSYKE